MQYRLIFREWVTFFDQVSHNVNDTILIDSWYVMLVSHASNACEWVTQSELNQSARVAVRFVVRHRVVEERELESMNGNQ